MASSPRTAAGGGAGGAGTRSRTEPLAWRRRRRRHGRVAGAMAASATTSTATSASTPPCSLGGRRRRRRKDPASRRRPVATTSNATISPSLGTSATRGRRVGTPARAARALSRACIRLEGRRRRRARAMRALRVVVVVSVPADLRYADPCASRGQPLRLFGPAVAVQDSKPARRRRRRPTAACSRRPPPSSRRPPPVGRCVLEAYAAVLLIDVKHALEEAHVKEGALIQGAAPLHARHDRQRGHAEDRQ